MNVLSLFDGISCGQIALQRAGIKVDNYFASEIDKHAIKVTQHNWPNTTQLGSVVDVKAENLPKIDLIIGGFCCQSFSLAGKQLNFNDPRGKLFFECVRLLKEIRENNPNVYFMFENVKMKKEYENIISEYLRVKPILINSALVSAQNRQRLYWTNIPNVNPPEDKGILLPSILKKLDFNKDYYEDNFKQHHPVLYTKDKFKCLVASGGGRTKERAICNLDGSWRFLTPTEGESLQTVPHGYTSMLSENQRFKCLGNGWTVDVIAHIFQNLPKE